MTDSQTEDRSSEIVRKTLLLHSFHIAHMRAWRHKNYTFLDTLGELYILLVKEEVQQFAKNHPTETN